MKGLFLFFFLISFSLYSQERARIQDNRELLALQQIAAEKNILKLKDAFLLIRINLREKEISYYESFHNNKAADKVKKRQEKKNTQILKAFQENFDFCKAYFFSMSDSRKLFEGKIDSVKFYNFDMNLVNPDGLISNNYFIAEFSSVESDTTFFYKGKTPSPQNQKNPEGYSYFGNEKFNLPALVIRNRDFVQLRDPFPYYTAYNPGGNINKRYSNSIRKLNLKLEKYYSYVRRNIIQDIIKMKKREEEKKRKAEDKKIQLLLDLTNKELLDKWLILRQDQEKNQ